MIIQCFSKNLGKETLSGIHKFGNFVCLNIDACRLTIRIVPIIIDVFPKTINFKVFFAFFIEGFSTAFLNVKNLCVLKSSENRDYKRGDRWDD